MSAATATVAAPAAAPPPSTSPPPAKQEVRMEFLCERMQLKKRESVPRGLIGPRATASPLYRKMFEQVMEPICMKNASEALQACEEKCSSKGCEKAAVEVVSTPMSYLHNEQDPFVIIMTVACCGTEECEVTLKKEARDLMLQMVGQAAQNQAICSFALAPMARGQKCYCGSGHKYKKCCGKEDKTAPA